MSQDIFFTKALKPKGKRKRDATAVCHHPFTQEGEFLKTTGPILSKKEYKQTSIITIFSGSDNGKSEAERLCRMLNLAYDAFHHDWKIAVDMRASVKETMDYINGDNDRYHG